MIQTMFNGYLPETYLLCDHFELEVVVVEKVIGRVVHAWTCQVNALRFVPVWWKCVYHKSFLIFIIYSHFYYFNLFSIELLYSQSASWKQHFPTTRFANGLYPPLFSPITLFFFKQLTGCGLLSVPPALTSFLILPILADDSPRYSPFL